MEPIKDLIPAKVKLVEDWHRCWRWLSMQMIALGAALQVALLALPSEMHSALPEWSQHAIALLILVGAALGRLFTSHQPEKDSYDSHP